MTLVVDFNMIDERGLVPALVSIDRVHAMRGEKVIAADGEGLECWAEVIETVETPRGAYVLLAPVGDTWRTDSDFRPSSQEASTRLARQELSRRLDEARDRVEAAGLDPSVVGEAIQAARNR